MSTKDPRRREWSPTGTFIEQCPDEAAHGEHEWYEKNCFRRQCPGFVGRAGVPASATPAARWVTCQYRQEPHELDDECVDATDVPWTPGAGWERLKQTMPGMVPDLTEEDLAKADALIASTAKRCPRCGETRQLGKYRVCQPCAAACGWDPRCEACIAEEKQHDLVRDDHIATCDPGRRAAGGATGNPELKVDESWFTTADVEAARQWLADNRYGGDHDMHDLDRDDIHEIIQIVLTATWQRARREGISDGLRRAHACIEALAELVQLKGGPRDEEYERRKPLAWQRAGEALSAVGPWEPVEQPEPASGGIITNPAPTIVAEDGCTLTWPTSTPADRPDTSHVVPTFSQPWEKSGGEQAGGDRDGN